MWMRAPSEASLWSSRRIRLATLSLIAAAIGGFSGLASSSQAHADPITVTNVALPYNETVTITGPGGLNVTAYTGQIQLTTSIGLLDVSERVNDFDTAGVVI